jgi:hypothetical protein
LFTAFGTAMVSQFPGLVAVARKLSADPLQPIITVFEGGDGPPV